MGLKVFSHRRLSVGRPILTRFALHNEWWLTVWPPVRPSVCPSVCPTDRPARDRPTDRQTDCWRSRSTESSGWRPALLAHHSPVFHPCYRCRQIRQTLSLSATAAAAATDESTGCNRCHPASPSEHIIPYRSVIFWSTSTIYGAISRRITCLITNEYHYTQCRSLITMPNKDGPRILPGGTPERYNPTYIWAFVYQAITTSNFREERSPLRIANQQVVCKQSQWRQTNPGPRLVTVSDVSRIWSPDWLQSVTPEFNHNNLFIFNNTFMTILMYVMHDGK